ncbi:MAG TPA: hypothetical protein VFA92_11040 [Candidatus Binatia bacterium]|jgi:hypothetical protein|nr:hypothetical protein [Candidatus Binatia bacterium]
MPARIPQDVDLEDRLVLGLTPVRFGYLVIGGLAAFCVWNARWGPVPARLTFALPLLLGGVTLAWGRWGGRPLDAWVGDLALFLRANVRVVRAPAPPAASADAPAAEPETVLAIRAPVEVPALPAPSAPGSPVEPRGSAKPVVPVQRNA